VRLFIALSVGLACVLATPSSVTAQHVIAGVVRDSAGAPIPAVQVRLNGREATRTDSSGRFRVNGVTDRFVSVMFRRLGFDPVSRSIDTQDPAAVEVAMTSNDQLLRTIVVEGQAYDKDLWTNGFYHRRKIASGSFFDPDYLAHFGGSGVGSLMHEVPRVDIQRKGNQDYAFSTVGGNRCRMNVYVDGMFQRVAMPGPNGDDGMGLGDLIDYRDIRAVEVYPRAMSVPTQFSRMGPGAGKQGRPMPRVPSPTGLQYATAGEENSDAACGAIVIWTKTPGEK
jgi:hypothetical protein